MELLKHIAITTIIFIVFALLIGFFGQYYMDQNDCAQCTLGSGGSCEIVGSCPDSSLCWAPLCQGGEIAPEG